MPITQDRMLKLIAEATALREYMVEYAKLVKWHVESIRKCKPEMLISLLDAMLQDLQMMPKPETETIAIEQYHFSKLSKYNDRQKKLMRARRGHSVYTPSTVVSTKSDGKAAAQAALDRAARKFEEEPQSATPEDIEEMFDPSKPLDLGKEELPKFDQALHDKLNQALAEPDKKKDG